MDTSTDTVYMASLSCCLHKIAKRESGKRMHVTDALLDEIEYACMIIVQQNGHYHNFAIAY